MNLPLIRLGERVRLATAIANNHAPDLAGVFGVVTYMDGIGDDWTLGVQFDSGVCHEAPLHWFCREESAHACTH